MACAFVSRDATRAWLARRKPLRRSITMKDGDTKRLCVSGAAVFLLAAGCTVGPKYRPPAATQTPVPPVYKESPTQFKETDGWAVARPGDAMLRGKWWEIFKEPELNSLEERLNIDNE